MNQTIGFVTRILVASLLCVGLYDGLMPSATAVAADVEGIRSSVNDERTRVVIDLASHGKFTHHPMADPPRIVVEMPSGTFLGSTAPVSLSGGYVQRVRKNQLRDGRIQVVLDLSRALSYKLFTLDGPSRIVIDVAHSGKPAQAPQESQPKPEPKPAPKPEPAPTPKPEPAPTPEPEAPPVAVTADDVPDPTAPTRIIVPPRTGPWVIAVDAGHGGGDPGASYHSAEEKDVTLELAKYTVEELNKRPGVEAFLIRKGDYFIPLWKRWTMADQKNADLFVSIHCNASKSQSAKGTEVYFLSLEGASDQASKELAEFENSVDERMGVASDAPELDRILFDMMQTDVLVKSEYLAETCLNELFGLGTVYNRGVKQAKFAVLHSPRMPSILVEAAFISNPRENALLRDRGWQRMFGRLLADGIHLYCRSVQEAE